MKKILIIEDNKDLQEIYRHSFEKDGYTVVSKDNGQDGYDAITTELPDVILLDLMMPGVNGFDFLQNRKGNLVTTWEWNKSPLYPCIF